MSGQRKANPPDYRGVREVVAKAHARRQAALKNPIGSGLTVVRCKTCKRPIATTAVDQAKGEPPILLDFPDEAGDWECTDCWGGIPGSLAWNRKHGIEA